MILRPYPRLGEMVYQARLSSGLRARVIKKPGFAKRHAFLAVDYGSIDTNFFVNGTRHVSPCGVAHYLEHKMFDMPDGNASQMFAQYGSDSNAFTSYDMTAYYVECTDHFQENLEILLRFVTTPFFTEETVEKERGIIEQEILMYEDNAESVVYEKLFEAVYGNHPVRHTISGTISDVRSITVQTLNTCYSAFYRPEHMMLCVVGDVDPEMVFELADRIVCLLPQETLLRDYGAPEPLVPKKKRTERQMEIAMPTFSLGFKAEPAELGSASAVQELIGELASEVLVGESSDLYSQLYEIGWIDADFGAGYESLKGVSMLTAGGDSLYPEKVAEMIWKEAERICRDGIPNMLFGQLKRSALGRRIRDLDSFESICYRVCACEFEGVDYFDFPDLFQKVTEEQVVDFLARTVSPERAALSVIWPKE